METKKPSPEEVEIEKQEVAVGPAPRVVPTYDRVNHTKTNNLTHFLNLAF